MHIKKMSFYNQSNFPVPSRTENQVKAEKEQYGQRGGSVKLPTITSVFCCRYGRLAVFTWNGSLFCVGAEYMQPFIKEKRKADT